MKCHKCEAKISKRENHVKLPTLFAEVFLNVCMKCPITLKEAPTARYYVWDKPVYFLVKSDTIQVATNQVISNVIRVTVSPTLVSIRKEITLFPEFELDPKTLSFRAVVGDFLYSISPVHTCD